MEKAKLHGRLFFVKVLTDLCFSLIIIAIKHRLKESKERGFYV